MEATTLTYHASFLSLSKGRPLILAHKWHKWHIRQTNGGAQQRLINTANMLMETGELVTLLVLKVLKVMYAKNFEIV